MFIQIIQGRCTEPDRLREHTERWTTDIAPGAVGWLGGTFGMADDDTFVGVIRFDSRESAQANSRRPEQSRWWADAEQCFDGQVTFHDCDDVALMLDGGSDTAGFVQVIQGKAEDADRLKTMMTTETETLHSMRPDIIGASLAIEPDGTFTETVAFTDEESARRGEQQAMPEEMQREMAMLMHDVTYLDLHHPWFASARR